MCYSFLVLNISIKLHSNGRYHYSVNVDAYYLIEIYYQMKRSFLSTFRGSIAIRFWPVNRGRLKPYFKVRQYWNEPEKAVNADWCFT